MFNHNELSRIEMNPEPKYNKLRKKFYDQDEFYKLRRDFVEKVASYVSEFMICFLLFEQNFNVKFVQNIGNQKKYDLLLDDIPCDIKTILDEYPWFDQPENQLQEELIKSLKRTKVQEKIEEAMKQGARIIFLSATQTSMGKGANQETGAGWRLSIQYITTTLCATTRRDRLSRRIWY